jgi:hypothetical protein
MHWRSRSFPSGGTLERRQLAQSVFEKPAKLFVGMFFATIGFGLAVASAAATILFFNLD